MRDQGTGLPGTGQAGGPAPSRRRHAAAGRRGAALVNTAVGLLFALAAGLYAVSLRAQFDYVMTVKRESAVSWIEAVALDAGMVIFTLLALGLARAGQPARIERLAIVACALGSAAMNLAAADTASVRSVLAFVMPPIFLALVVDRTVTVVRRHYLGESDASAWSQLGRVCLYLLRFVLAPLSTAAGLRRRILRATPVPSRETPSPQLPPGTGDLDAKTAADLARQARAVIAALKAAAAQIPRQGVIVPAPAKAMISAGRDGTKTARFLALVIDRHGPLDGFPLGDVSRVCTELAPHVDLDPGAARTALRRQVLAAQTPDPDRPADPSPPSDPPDGSTR